jgi:hypothetical protein
MRKSPIIIGITLMVAVLGLWQAVPAGMPGAVDRLTYNPNCQADATPMDFSLQSCTDECRSRYGLQPWSEDITPQRRGGDGGSNMYELYAVCVQDCQSKFWKDYDKRMKDLEKE